MIRRLARAGRLEADQAAAHMRAIQDAERLGKRVLVVTDLDSPAAKRREAA